MITLAGLFFSIISIFGLVRCKSKTSIRKMVLLAFSIFLIFVQFLFINSILDVGGQEFLAISGLLGGVVLILGFQKDMPEDYS